MSKLEAKQFTSPIGRLVSGSVDEAITEDFDGNPLTIKSGPDQGKPTQRYNFSVAYPKAGTAHWSQVNELGKLIYETGYAHMPRQAPADDFSWKVADGDSTKVNKKGNRNCDKEGYPGHWVFHFSSAYPPSTYNGDGSAPVPAESVKRGHYVQVAGSVVGNESDGNPGVYLNHNMVAHSGFGPEIKSGADPKAAGFGGALPPGASKAPVSGLPGSAPPPPAPLPTRAPPPPAAAAPPPPPVAVQPSAAFIAPPPAPPAPVGPKMTATAQGTYEAYKASGWSDDQMRTAGFLV